MRRVRSIRAPATIGANIMIKFQFETSDSQEPKLNKFLKHKCKYKNQPTAIGGRISYKFTPTGLGCIIVVSCVCGKEVNLSDYENW